MIKEINEQINLLGDAGQVSDGYHTFDNLYKMRMAYNAALVNTLEANTVCRVYKSYKHYDGELCFGGGWFIVIAMLPTGQISNHYENKYWDLFKIPEYDSAVDVFDGHTEEDVIDRLLYL